MGTIGVIGVLISIVLIIYLGYKGVNLVLNSLLAAVIIIVTNAMPFWDAITNGYIPSMQSFVGSYMLLLAELSRWHLHFRVSPHLQIPYPICSAHMLLQHCL